MLVCAWFKSLRDNRFLALCVVAASFLAAGADAQSQQPIYPTSTFTPPLGVVLSSLAVGDFNEDGQQDLAYVWTPSEQPPSGPVSTLTVLLTQGSNSPIAVSSSLTGCLPSNYIYSLVAADLNKDSKLDLVLTCPAGSVAVLLGNGDGSFQSPAYYAVSGAQTLAPPVDLNGDGYLDLAVDTLLGSSSGVAVLMNQGGAAPGKLLAAVSYPGPAGATPGATGAGDFNGDGKQDIVIGGFSLSVFYGNGDGTLQPMRTFPGGPTFVTADFNHDGLTDIACIGGSLPQPPILQVLLGSTSGNLNNVASIKLDPNLGYPYPFLAGTRNGGSNVDLALVGTYTTILMGDGSGGFSYGNSYALTGLPAATEDAGGGKTNLVLDAVPGFTVLAGNGDGTFQGFPRILLGQLAAPASNTNGQFVTADLNGDGLTDVVGVDAMNNLISALGRGDGTFSTVNSVYGSGIGTLAVGDFNGDGKIDAVAISETQQDSTLFFYAGNGAGGFQPSFAGVDLQAPGAEVPVVGDFNSDGFLDVVVPYSPNFPLQVSGLIFVPGKGNGTFGTPVPFSQLNYPNAPYTKPVLSSDLNHDKKPDLVWNNTVYLGNGDGTFQQMPLGLTGTPLGLADLNGDAIPDIVMNEGLTLSVYAGNGNGTFQTSAMFTEPLSSQSVTETGSVSIGDVNADGHPDLVFQYFTIENINTVLVLLGDGAGHFTADSNFYYTTLFNNASGGALARLNNQAPPLPNDHALDYLSFTLGAVMPLLNQANAEPAAVSAADFSIALSLAAARVTAGQTAKAMLTITPLAGYHQTVTFSCGPLPSEAVCTFAPATVAFSTGSAANVQLTITTAAPSTGSSVRLAGGTGFLLLLCSLAGKCRRRTGALLSCACLLAGLMAFSGCGGSSNPSAGPSAPSGNPGTPAGTQTITVSTTDGTITHSVTFQIVIQSANL